MLSHCLVLIRSIFSFVSIVYFHILDIFLFCVFSLYFLIFYFFSFYILKYFFTNSILFQYIDDIKVHKNNASIVRFLFLSQY